MRTPLPSPWRRAAPFFRPSPPDRFTLLLIALALAGVGLALARQLTYGVMLTWDSINYIAVARNLLAGEGFFNLDGSIYRLWPPLYPAALAGVGLGVFDPYAVAGPLNAVIFGLTVLSTGQYLRRRLESRFLVYGVCLAVAWSIPLTDLAAWALPGPAFVLLSILALIQTDRFLTDGKGSALVWAAVFSALAWQTRYLGAAIPVTVGLLLLFQPGAALPEKAQRLAGYALIVAIPMGLWLLRNFLLTGALVGNRRPVNYAWPELLDSTGSVIAGWTQFDLLLLGWKPADLSPPMVALALAALAVAILAAILIVGGYLCLRDSRKTGNWGAWRPSVIFGGFALAYLVLLITGAMSGATLHGIQPRYLSVLYLPLLLAAALALDRFLSYERERKLLGSAGKLPLIRALAQGSGQNTSLLAVILVIAASLWMAGQVPLQVLAISRANSEGSGYGGKPWAESETLRYIRENPLSGQVWSNNPALTYLHDTGADNHLLLPRPRSRASTYTIPQESDEFSTSQEWLGRWIGNVPDGAYAVWFYHSFGSSLFNFQPVDMRAAPGLEPVADLSDGLIFRVNRNYIDSLNPYRLTAAAIAAGDFGEPAAQSAFDIYLKGDTLTYFKRPCGAADTGTRFFLHLIPVNRDELPDGRKQYGFDNIHFDFDQRGVIFDGKCLMSIPLPNYDTIRIRTGQFISGEGQIWKAEFPVP